MGRKKNYSYLHGAVAGLLPVEKLSNCVHLRNRITEFFKQQRVGMSSSLGLKDFCFQMFQIPILQDIMDM